MPIYEYQCTHCHHQFDVLQKIADLPVTKCPKCSEEKAIRLVSAAAFQLKGSGWYATDFKTKTPESTTRSSGSASTSETATKTETSKTTDDKKSTTAPETKTSSKQSQGETN